MHTAKDNHIGFRLGCFSTEAERIANEIGDVLNFRPLIIVGDNHRVSRSRQMLYLCLQLGVKLFGLGGGYHSMCLPLHFRLARGKSLL